MTDHAVSNQTVSEEPAPPAWLYRALESSGMCAFELDIPSDTARCSASCERVIGRPGQRSCWGFKTLVASTFPDDQELVRARLKEAVRTGAYSVEFRSLGPDGILRWLSIRGRVSSDERGEPRTLLGIIQDVTERKRLERILFAQQEALRALVESATLAESAPKIISAICRALEWAVGAIWVLDPEAKELRCVAVGHLPSVQAPEFENISREITFGPGVGLPGRVWSSREPVWVSNVVGDPNFPRARYAMQDGLHAAFGFPILSGEKFSGVIEFFSREILKPEEDVLRTMGVIGNVIGDFLERMRAEETLRATNRELEAKLAEIEQMNQIMLGREERIIELKEENKALKMQAAAKVSPS